ncbi:probable 4-coumarate--CoA ligase 1 [Toxorhynchites rutilus septentrionalis]|uniref:probable 4-coumarate--CoA ligase 1 n=1 Tax=Toxorhynchites rutilus septentrionalis TaxID=329112 RepID=UPI00247ABABD|nr:probable 4-coumarate--CoA ligase 1 [Toxorhynchites rutilus septentrionalis]
MSRFDPTTRTWVGPRQPPVINPAASLGQVIVNILERTPDRVFEIDVESEVAYTCDELRIRSIRAALNLAKKCGVSQGDMICMVVSNSCSVTPLLFGCFLLGAPVHTLDASFDESDLRQLMSLTQPKLVFCNQHNRAVVEAACSQANLNARVMVLDTAEVTGMLFEPVENEKLYRPAYLGDSDRTIAVVVCSSGTTGFPKAVCLTHAQLIAPYPRVSHLGSDTLLCFSSLYWVSALQVLMIALFNGGKRIVTVQPFSPVYAYELIERFKITYLFTPPPMLADMVEYCEARRCVLPSSLRIIGCGGSPLPESLEQRANELLKTATAGGKVYVGYAMSETGGIVSINLSGKPRSVGMLMANVTVRIVNEEGDFLGAEQEGELQVRYIHPFAGYYGNEQETRALLTADGFIQTGDIGYFDKVGFLYITDRKKEMLRYQGYQIAPAQLEAVLMELADVSQAVVVELPHPKPPHVDLASALVVRTLNAAAPPLTEQQLLDYVNGRVPDYKQLRGGIFFVDSIPRLPNGKINRRDAKKLALRLSQINH